MHSCMLCGSETGCLGSNDPKRKEPEEANISCQLKCPAKQTEALVG